MQRLSGLDASFLYLETSAQPLHVCSVLEIDPSTIPGGYSFDRMREALTLRIKAMPEFREKDFSAANLQRILGSLSNWSNPPSQVRNKQPWRTIRQQVSKNETWFNGNTGTGAYTVIDRVDWLLSLWLYRLDNIMKSGKPEDEEWYLHH